MGWTGRFVLLHNLMVPYLRKFGKATKPDFIGDRFYSKARLVAVICAIFICMTYIGPDARWVSYFPDCLTSKSRWASSLVEVLCFSMLAWVA